MRKIWDKLFKKSEPQVEEDPKVILWGCLSSILTYEDVGEFDRGDGRVFLKMKVSIGDLVTEGYVGFEDEDQAQAMVDHFNTKFEPIEVQS